MKQFKRIISLVLAMTMIISMFGVTMVTAFAEEDATYVLGDIDGNGTVNIFDASYIQKALAGQTGFELAEDSIEFATADVNKDGKVNVFDVTLIQQYVAQFANALNSGIGETFVYVDPNKPTEPTEEPTKEPTEEPTVEETEIPTEEPTVEETEEPTVEETEEPTVEDTEIPTEEPTVAPAHAYTVAGAIAPGHTDGGIFTDAWNPACTANDLAFDEETGLFKVTYTDVDALGEEAWYEYKVVEDYAWDKAYTDVENGEANAKFSVVADDSTVTIYFDGTKCWAEVVAPVVPTEEPTVEVTEEPTVEETEEPTVEETEIPTEEPTQEVTEEPTEKPTEQPTEKPTEKPTEPPVPTYTAYFVNSGKWSKVNAYAWSPENAAWPGKAMTKTADKAPNGADVYSITFTTNYANIIFNDGSSQTSDLTFQSGQYYDFATSKWYAKLSDIPSAAPTGYTVYCVNSKNWSTINAYVWNPNAASWPGSAMTKTGEKSPKGYDVYSFTSVQKHGNIIFNNGSSQTDNLTFQAGQYFDLSTNKWYANLADIK